MRDPLRGRRGRLLESSIADLQGGCLLARAHRDPSAMRRALAGAMALLASSAP